MSNTSVLASNHIPIRVHMIAPRTHPITVFISSRHFTPVTQVLPFPPTLDYLRRTGMLHSEHLLHVTDSSRHMRGQMRHLWRLRLHARCRRMTRMLFILHGGCPWVYQNGIHFYKLDIHHNAYHPTRRTYLCSQDNSVEVSQV